MIALIILCLLPLNLLLIMKWYWISRVQLEVLVQGLTCTNHCSASNINCHMIIKQKSIVTPSAKYQMFTLLYIIKLLAKLVWRIRYKREKAYHSKIYLWKQKNTTTNFTSLFKTAVVSYVVFPRTTLIFKYI